MPPRGIPNPPALTESARAARAAFHCDLCSKGYSRQNEYDTHLTSYEHNHKQRLNDLKSLNRNMAAGSRPKNEEKGSGLIKIQPIELGAKKDEGKGGFKKGGFKCAFGKVEEPDVVVKVEPGLESQGGDEKGAKEVGVVKARDRGVETAESDTEDEGYECYDPRRPTGCRSNCRGRI